MAIREFHHDRPEDLAAAVAYEIATKLRQTLAQDDRQATFIVPGGTTPPPIFLRLSIQELEWDRVLVTPGDERWVQPPHPDSNETLARDHLLTNKAARAKFFPIYKPMPLPSQAQGILDQELAAITHPKPIVWLGLGPDGHFASLFPGMVELEKGLALDGESFFLGVDEPKNGYPRMTMTLSYLLKSDRIFLVFDGREKRDLIDHCDGLPIAALLNQERAPIDIHWME